LSIYYLSFSRFFVIALNAFLSQLVTGDEIDYACVPELTVFFQVLTDSFYLFHLYFVLLANQVHDTLKVLLPTNDADLKNLCSQNKVHEISPSTEVVKS